MPRRGCWISSFGGAKGFRHCLAHRCPDICFRAWEPRWLLPGETIVADEAQRVGLRRTVGLPAAFLEI